MELQLHTGDIGNYLKNHDIKPSYQRMKIFQYLLEKDFPEEKILRPSGSLGVLSEKCPIRKRCAKEYGRRGVDQSGDPRVGFFWKLVLG